MAKERYLSLDVDGSFCWIDTDRGIMLDVFHDVIGCDMVEQVHIPLGFCMLVDESGKIKNPPQRVNRLASRLYPGSMFGDPIVGPVIFVRIGLVDGEYDWCPLLDKDLSLLSLFLGVEIPDLL